MKEKLLELIARDYFQYLGTHFPQQCASDEFYFFPRSETAIEHLNTLDDLRQDKIQDHVKYLRHLLVKIPSELAHDLEEKIDLHLLKQSMESFIREFDDFKVWKKDPTLYVKIPLFAIDQMLSQENRAQAHMRSDLLSLFDQIPNFLSVASHNLHNPSEMTLKVALDMTQDALDYFTHDIHAFIMEQLGEDEELIKKQGVVLRAWDQYKKYLLALPTVKSFAIGEEGLQKILTLSWRYSRSPEEILRIAHDASMRTQERLHALAGQIDPDKPWNVLIYDKFPQVSSKEDVLALYQKEVEALRRFIYSKDVITLPPCERIVVRQTPSYLQSLRATASYRAPLTGRKNGQGVFYITPGQDDLALIAGHCPYLSAHETYPGHHILDHLRIHHPNPIRRQIESPLFYEGWACYAETLLDEFGYVQNPRQQLVQLKRQLWRDLRAILDVKLQTGMISPNQAAKEITALGFSSSRAERQVRRFCMTPGYQLCYFIGMCEINRLRDQFSPYLDLKSFHDTLLEGGQIPFHLVENRMEALLKTDRGH